MYSFAFEIIFFILLLILLLQHTLTSTTTNWNNFKNYKTIIITIQIIFYLFEFFFIVFLIKHYYFWFIKLLIQYLSAYTIYSVYIVKFTYLYIYILKYTWCSTMILITTNPINIIKSLIINLDNSTLWQYLVLSIFTDLIDVFKLILVFNYILINHILDIILFLSSSFNTNIIYWLEYYYFLPIFQDSFSSIKLFTANNYNYSLFDYSYFTFYNKYIILIFLLFYYFILYTYYKIPLLYKINLQSKYNYLFSYEYPILLGFLFLGYILVISTNNLLIVYLGFEIQTFTILIISGQLRTFYIIALTNLKYFFYSFLSSLFFLISLLYLYNFAGTLNYYEIYLFLLYNWEFNLNNLFISTGLLFLFSSFFFKLGVFPFYIWVLDIFEGFPRFVTLLLLTLNKFNLYIFLLKFLTIITTFNLNLCNYVIHILTFTSLFSLFIGSLLALSQSNIHRFFGATSITHMGLLLLLIKINLISTEIYTYYIIYSYFILYMFLTFLFFLILLFWNSLLTILTNKVSNNNNNIFFNFNFNFIKDLSWLNFYSKKSLLVLILILLNFSGFPPFSFFYIKLNLVWLLLEKQFYLDTILILYFSTLITGSYLRLISIILLENTLVNTKNFNLYKYFSQLNSNNYSNKIYIIKTYILKYEYTFILLTLISLFYNYIYYLI